MACGAEPNCFRAVSCFTLEPSFFFFLPHLDTNFRSRSPLGPFSNFHVIALLTFEAKTISLLVWYAQTSTSTSMTFNYCISIRFVFFSFYLSPRTSEQLDQIHYKIVFRSYISTFMIKFKFSKKAAKTWRCKPQNKLWHFVKFLWPS